MAIELMDPNQSSKGMGYHICLVRNQAHAHQAIITAVNKICRKISSVYLVEQGARQAMMQSLTQKFEYKLELTSFNETQYRKINAAVNKSCSL